MENIFDWLYISDSIFKIIMMVYIISACKKYIRRNKWRKVNGHTEYINLRTKKRQLSFLKMVGIVKAG